MPRLVDKMVWSICEVDGTRRNDQYGYVTGSGGHQAAGFRAKHSAADRNEPAGDFKKSGNRAQAAQSTFRRQTKELLAETLWQIIN